MLHFRKSKSKRNTVPTTNHRTKPFATSNRVRIADDAELLYPGLLETRSLDNYDAREQIMVEQAIHNMLSHPSAAPVSLPQPLDLSKAPRPRVKERKPPPVPPKHGSVNSPADKLRHEIETYLEQPLNKLPAVSSAHIASQKKARPQRPKMPRKKSSQGRVHQSGRVQHTTHTSHRQPRSNTRPATSRHADTLPEVMRKFRESDINSQRSTKVLSQSISSGTPVVRSIEADVESLYDTGAFDFLDWDEVPILLDL